VLLATAVLLAVFVLPPGLGIALVVLALVAEIGELMLWQRFLRRIRVSTGAEGLIGGVGEAITACDPEGSVRIRGEIWKAHAEPYVGAGEPVVVAAVRGLTLEVTPDAADAGSRMTPADIATRGEA
jgi:membrane-bound serine protease (ClpP class)